MTWFMGNKKIVGYCRVSTLEQKKKGFGIDIQVREIEKFAKENRLIVERIFKDEAVSGIEENKKELDILCSLCKKGEIEAVIFPSTDRTSRSVRLSENLYYELNKNGVRIYLTDMPYYNSDNHGDVMFRQIKEVIAEGNRNAIIARLKKGREERARKGRLAGGTVPYGYTRENKGLKKNKNEAKIIRAVYKLAKQGKKSQHIADCLNQKEYCMRNGKGWTQRQVWAILHREELYKKGIVKYGKVTGENKKLIIVYDN